MDAVFTYFFYGATFVLLTISFVKDKNKTRLALNKAWKMFLTVLPQFAAILLLTGLLLAVLRPETIQNMIGAKSGFIGMLAASLIGSVALVPALIAFPITAELLKNGAGIAQMTVFISTLTTVGFITLPVEAKYLGKKAALFRNMLAYVFSFAAAYIIGGILT